MDIRLIILILVIVVGSGIFFKADPGNRD